MNDLLRSPLGPAIVLLVASALLRVFASPRKGWILALLTLVPLSASFLLLMTLRASGVVVRELVWWPLVTPPLRVLWALDGWNWLALSLLLLIGGAAVLLTWQTPGKRAGAFHGLSLALLAAASLTVVSDNLLALSGAWVATDILLVARARGSRAQANTPPVWLEVAGSLLMLVAIGITSIGIASTTLATARLPVEAMALMLLAAALRMAAYPLHLWLVPSSVARDRGTQLLINGLGMITGAWLLGRIFSLGAGTWLSNPVWPPLLVLLTLGAGLAAWVGDGRNRLAMLGSGRSTWLWLVTVLAATATARDALGWALAGVILALILLAVGQAIGEEWRWRVPVWVAVATLAGVPLTAGMAARAYVEPSLALLLLMTVADGLAVAGALQTLRAPQPTAQIYAAAVDRPEPQGVNKSVNWSAVRLLTALGLALVPNLLWGTQPARLAMQAGFNLTPTLGELLTQLGFVQLFAILLALALGLGFYQLTQPGAAQGVSWQPRVAQIASLGWMAEGARWLAHWVALAWRNALLIVEGEGYWGWVVLALLLAALAIQL